MRQYVAYGKLITSANRRRRSTVTTSRSWNENSSTVLAGSVKKNERCNADSNSLALKFFRFRKVRRMASSFAGLKSSEAITSLWSQTEGLPTVWIGNTRSGSDLATRENIYEIVLACWFVDVLFQVGTHQDILESITDTVIAWAQGFFFQEI